MHCRAAFAEFDAKTVANLTDKQMMSISSEYGIDMSKVRGVVDNKMFLYGCTCSEADEIYKICSVIGSPTTESWADGLKLAKDMNYQFPQVSFSKLGHCYFLFSALGVLVAN